MGLVPQAVSERDISGGQRSNLVAHGAANKAEAEKPKGQITSQDSSYGVPMKTGETSREPEISNEVVKDDDEEANQNERETSSNQTSGNSPFILGVDGLCSSSLSWLSASM